VRLADARVTTVPEMAKVMEGMPGRDDEEGREREGR
jgi:hypothetical protein